MTDSIMAPDINLIKTDEFYLFYEMMMQSLKTDDVKGGINKSLFMLHTYLKSGNISIFRKNKEGSYVFKLSDSQMDDLVQPVSCIINKTKPLAEQKGIFNLDLNLSERLKNMMLFHIGVSSNSNSDNRKAADECIMAILNVDKEKVVEPQFWDRVKDTMQIILKRAASYERNVSAITTDLLTGLDNRNSYEMRIRAFNEADENLVLAIFDLFRLKYINDNYTHAKGDAYITEAGDILSKYWPKQKIVINENEIETAKDTGHCVYRVGGDEFVLLTSKETYTLTTIKAALASQEAEMIDLDLGEETPIGINYGVVQHTPGDSFKQTFMRADERMQEDKGVMYKKYKLDRRH